MKLRPALPDEQKAGKRKEHVLAQSSWPSNDAPQWIDSQDTTLDTCPRPFQDLLLCATGIQNKVRLLQCCLSKSCQTAITQVELFKKALELGASSASNFTDMVTHLIAEEPGTAKYKARRTFIWPK